MPSYGGLKKKPVFLKFSAPVDSDSTSAKQTPGIQRKQRRRRKNPPSPEPRAGDRRSLSFMVRHSLHRLAGVVGRGRASKATQILALPQINDSERNLEASAHVSLL